MKFNRSIAARLGAAVLAVGALGAASVAQARDNVYFSIGANIAPGVVVGASNYAPRYYAPPVYAAPVYAAPVYAPSYVAAAPVYVEQAPYYGYGYAAPVVVAPRVYRSGYPRHGHGHGHWR